MEIYGHPWMAYLLIGFILWFIGFVIYKAVMIPVDAVKSHKRGREHKQQVAHYKERARQEAIKREYREIARKEDLEARQRWNSFYIWKSFDEVCEMGGEGFERYLVKLLKAKGYTNARQTKRGADQGIDILYTDNDGNKVGIQAKRYKDAVGNRAVQELLGGMVYYQCQIGIVITTSYFTRSAKELAAKDNRVSLWDSKNLEKFHSEIVFDIPPYSKDKAVELGII